MRLVSVNAGLPRTVRWKGRDVTTGIFKEPVEGRIPPEPRRTKRFLASRRTGYYLAVQLEGDVGAGDRVEARACHPARIPVAEIIRAYASDRDDLATIERLIGPDALPEDWRRYFEKKLAENAAAA